ncbi:MAG: hypothetical protein R8M45_05530, partial [Ghiorsea sp.]
SLAQIYHDQTSALFNAIQALANDPKQESTVVELCSIGHLISEDAANAANVSQKELEAVRS